MVQINETFAQLMEQRRPGSFFRTNKLAMQDFVSKFVKHDRAHVEAAVRYKMRLHEPTASEATVQKTVRTAVGVHHTLQTAEKRKKSATAKAAARKRKK